MTQLLRLRPIILELPLSVNTRGRKRGRRRRRRSSNYLGTFELVPLNGRDGSRPSILFFCFIYYNNSQDALSSIFYYSGGPRSVVAVKKYVR